MSIRKDPAVSNFLERMPVKIQESFSEEQLAHVKVAIGARSWGEHAFDRRGVIKFFKYRYYYVFLAGRNRRDLKYNEKKTAALTQAILVSIFSFFIITIFLFCVYLVKSALGIDIFSNYSFGGWGWFKGLF